MLERWSARDEQMMMPPSDVIEAIDDEGEE
jgi:hypothetical protein